MGPHLPVETTRGRACGGSEAVPGLRQAPAAPRSTASQPCPPLRLQTLLRNRRTSLQELRSHEVFLTKLNWELIKSIQDMEESSAQKVRAMLQQQDSLAVRFNRLRPTDLGLRPMHLRPAHGAVPLSARAPSPGRLHKLLTPSGRCISHTLLPTYLGFGTLPSWGLIPTPAFIGWGTSS